MLKLVVVGLLVAASSAQLCCNLEQECTAFDLTCDTSTQCYTDPRFLHICRDNPEDPFKPWIDDGWTRSGNWVYKHFGSSAVNYATAQSDCQLHIGLTNGNLAAEVLRHPDVVSNIYNQGWVKGGNGNACPWIGYTKTGGSWRWYDGGSTNSATTAWNSGEPNNAYGSETVAHIWTSQPTKILLNDLPTGSQRYYICEVKVI